MTFSVFLKASVISPWHAFYWNVIKLSTLIAQKTRVGMVGRVWNCGIFLLKAGNLGTLTHVHKLCARNQVLQVKEGPVSLATRDWLQVWENCGEQWLSAVYERDSHSQFDTTDMCFTALLEFGVSEESHMKWTQWCSFKEHPKMFFYLP